MKSIWRWIAFGMAFWALTLTAPAQSPNNNVVFPAATLTGTSQTSTPFPLRPGVSPGNGSFSAGTVCVTGNSLTTATFAVQVQKQPSGAYYTTAIESITAPGTFTTTTTVTANGCYEVNLQGVIGVQYQTSGTFTATSISLTLTASPNGQISRGGGSGGGSGFPFTLGTTSITSSSTTTSIDGLTLTGIPSITGPGSGTGTLTVTAGTGTNPLLKLVGSSGGAGSIQLLGGATSASYVALVPDSALTGSVGSLTIGPGGGTTTAATIWGVKCTTDSNGYCNPIVGQMSMYNTVGGVNTSTLLFALAGEGCLLSTGAYATTGGPGTCPLSIPVHEYNWVATGASSGFGIWDYQPNVGVGGLPSTWTQANGLFSLYGPTRISSSLSVGTFGGSTYINGATVNPTFTAGAGSGTGATTPVATSGFLPTFTEGSVTFTSGTSTSNASSLFQISGWTRQNKPVCEGQIAPAAGGTTQVLVPQTTTTTQNFYAAVSLTASTSYNASYKCQGN